MTALTLTDADLDALAARVAMRLTLPTRDEATPEAKEVLSVLAGAVARGEAQIAQTDTDLGRRVHHRAAGPCVALWPTRVAEVLLRAGISGRPSRLLHGITVPGPRGEVTYPAHTGDGRRSRRAYLIPEETWEQAVQEARP